ncbi:M48 family metallopeptidase [Paraflavitalea sp. CAU 1676]|uniref:M48 family metallopeptidase n=1 Tax=Paraflavitalea sp. CAU 1676 TaxID=3032598 RepID=UPI0023D9945D|nr:M48 family metallopeptidase [Paraflavitalea sp. CAU 1676]MDF2188206.1 M48 family metalloprotease [Paraflavitalea sp. CAU 1676]
MKPCQPASQTWYPLRIRLLSLVCTITLYMTVQAQNLPYQPAQEDESLLKQLFTQYEAQHKARLASLPTQYRDDYKKIYQSRWENIKARFDDKEIHTDKAAQQYLDELVNEIRQSNPVLMHKDFRCYFSRSSVPNASYIGQGIILINMGLFHRLDNESQAAFVIAHEIAHYLMNHSENAINNYVTRVNSKEIQEELRKIKGSEYGKREQFEKLVKGLTFSNRRHSRDHESEADSVAVALMSNTRFDPQGAVGTLALLDTIDVDRFNTAEALQSAFHSPGYPFQKKWIAKQQGLLGGHAELKEEEPLADSLKTHPDCQLRIQQVQTILAGQAARARQTDVISKSTFNKLRQEFRYEMVAHTYKANNYTRSLYLTILVLKENPADPWLITHAGNLFNAMYDAQKAHTLGRSIDLPAPGYASSYNLVLQFVQNLHREDMAAIGYHFLGRHQATLTAYAPFKEAYSKSAQIVKE